MPVRWTCDGSDGAFWVVGTNPLTSFCQRHRRLLTLMVICGATVVVAVAALFTLNRELPSFKAFHGIDSMYSIFAVSSHKQIRAAFKARSHRQTPVPFGKPAGLNLTSFDRVLQPVMTPGELLTLQWMMGKRKLLWRRPTTCPARTACPPSFGRAGFVRPGRRACGRPDSYVSAPRGKDLGKIESH